MPVSYTHLDVYKRQAREIARVLRFPSAIKREQFCRQRFELIEYRLADDNPLVGLQLSDRCV